MPVVYAAADRAVRKYAPQALDTAGLHHDAKKLRDLPEIINRNAAAAYAARAAAADAVRAAADAADTAYDAEKKQCADDFRNHVSFRDFEKHIIDAIHEME